MNLLSALLLSTALAAPALWKRALTADGTILAWLLCVAITAIGGMTAFCILAMTFLGTTLADKFAGKRADPNAIRRKSGARDAWRIGCNVGVGAIAVLFCALLQDQRFLMVYAAVMAESLADSLASKLGPLSSQTPRDICTGRPVPPGLSGGVTWLGSFSELLGAAVIGAIYGVGTADWKGAAIVCMAGFLSAMFDSVLGSRVQVKYRCSLCGAITERETHCDTETVRVSGWRCVSNDAVNLLSNAFSFFLALLLV